MISTSTNKLKVDFRYGLKLYRINVEQDFLAFVNSLALVFQFLGRNISNFKIASVLLIFSCYLLL